MNNGPWWLVDTDRDGGRWPLVAAGALLTGLAGTAIALVADGVGPVVGAEALFAIALALLITAGVWWQRARHDLPDVTLDRLPPRAAYAPGPTARLVGLDRSWLDTGGEPLAEIGHAGRVLAELQRLTSGPGEDDTVVAQLLDLPRRPAVVGGGGGGGGGGHRVTRTSADRTGGARGRRLRLEHRRGSDGDLDPAGAAGTAGGEGQEAPAVVVRLVDERGEPVAGAHAYRRGDLDDWVVPTATHRLRLRARRTHALTYRGRPTRRTFLDTDTDTDTDAAAYLARTRRRPRRWELTTPTDVDPHTVLLCLWLVHLLDVHTLLGRAWSPPTTSWTVVGDAFPPWVGPGGFGDPRLSAGPGAGA